MSGAVHRQLRTLLRSTRPRTLCSGAHLAVLHVYRLQPATVQPGTQPRLLFPEGRPRSAEESAAQLAEVCDRDEVVLMTESALTRLLGGDATPPALGDGSACGAAPPPLLSAGDEEAAGTDGGGAASAAAADSPGASVSLTGEETLPAVLAAHSVALADAVAPSAAEPPDWSSTRAWRQGKPPPTPPVPPVVRLQRRLFTAPTAAAPPTVLLQHRPRLPARSQLHCGCAVAPSLPPELARRLPRRPLCCALRLPRRPRLPLSCSTTHDHSTIPATPSSTAHLAFPSLPKPARW